MRTNYTNKTNGDSMKNALLIKWQNSGMKLTMIIMLITSLFLQTAFAQTTKTVGAIAATSTKYVKAGSTGANTGVDWANAYTTLDAALATAVSGNEIWVAAGTYKPGGASPTRSSTFAIPSGVKVYGGFNGTEIVLESRKLFNNNTILSGDIGVAGTNTDNVYHVVSFNGVSAGTELDGFTVTKGYADQAVAPDNGGGGINNLGGVSGSSPKISNCIIENNLCSRDGGGIMSYADAGTTANITITSCIIRGNTSSGHNGGGVEIAGWGSTSNGTLTNCIITGNVAVYYGSGIEFSNGYAPSSSTTGSIINSTISGNKNAEGLHVQVQSGTMNVTVANSIIYNNQSDIAKTTGGTMTLTNCDVQYSSTANWYTSSNIVNGGGNIDAVPVFFAGVSYSNAPTTTGDYRIRSNSPCADAGSNTANSESFDIRGPGYGRKLDKTSGAAGTIDIGAYEYNLASDVLTGVTESLIAPASYALMQNFPNPFNPSTTISYALPEKASIVLSVYNQLGVKVAVLANGDKAAGTHSVQWNAGNYASGVYFYELKTEKYSVIKKLILMK